jgi:hypothetical protein
MPGHGARGRSSEGWVPRGLFFPALPAPESRRTARSDFDAVHAFPPTEALLMLAEQATVPIAIHLDHATTDEDIDRALTFAEEGVAFDSIMVRYQRRVTAPAPRCLPASTRPARLTRAMPTRTTRISPSYVQVSPDTGVSSET